MSGEASDPSDIEGIDPEEFYQEHITEAIERRESVTSTLIGEFTENCPNGGNDDETRGIEHDGSTEVVLPFAYQKGVGYDTPIGNTESTYAGLLDTLRDEDDNQYPTGGDRPLVSPPSSRSTATDGTDPWVGVMPPAPPADSPTANLEMLEVYLATYGRDIPFADYGTDAADWSIEPSWLPSAYAEDRTRLARELEATFPEADTTMDAWIVDLGADLFRDRYPGCRVGPYVSQHLVHDVRIGAQTLNAKIAPIIDGDARFGLTVGDHREIVRSDRDGAEPGHESKIAVDRGDPRYAFSGLDLASQVRDDPAYQPYLLAALQLFGWGVSYAGDMPYTDNQSVLNYIDAGAVSLLDLLGRVTRNALLAAWHQKWFVHRRLRPETYAGRAQAALDGESDDLFEQFTTLRTPRELFESTGTALVPLLYPEGAPAHPAYPSGHSTIAGACATVLKTFFDNPDYGELLDSPDGPDNVFFSTDGTDKRDVADPSSLTVHGEINKLASNVGMGRIFAGVHYRSDHIYGMALGEQIAVATLYDHFRPVESDDESGDTQSSGDRAQDPVYASIDVGTDSPLQFTGFAGNERDITLGTFRDLRDRTRNTVGMLPQTIAEPAASGE